MKASLMQLQPWIAGALLQDDAIFNGVSTDSRAVCAGNLFVALRGEHFDAHAFLSEVANKGAAAIVAESLPESVAVPVMLVPNTRTALGDIARYWRQQFDIPVIGVTGSNGKTTVKEMIASILTAAWGHEHYLATRGNLNNDIGVPLTVMRLTAQCRAAVIELGMNHPGEIALLSAIAQPTLALVNNAQREHQEFMESVAAVARENGVVIRSLPDDGIAVFPADDPFTSLWREYAQHTGQRKIVTFGVADDADVNGTYRLHALGSEVCVRVGSRKFDVHLAAAGIHNVRNALAAIACTWAIGIHVDAIKHGLESFSPVHGRLQCKTARSGAMLIDDTYNANPDSVRAAIDVLAHAAAPRILVLGDMGEVGTQGRQYHAEIGAYARDSGITHFFALGELAAYAVVDFGAGGHHFDNVEDLNLAIEAAITPSATVLVKGSRFMKMERVVSHLLAQQVQETH